MSVRYRRADDAEWERQKEDAPPRYSFTRDQLVDAIARREAYPATAGPGQRVFISAESMADAIIEALETERRRAFRAGVRADAAEVGKSAAREGEGDGLEASP